MRRFMVAVSLVGLLALPATATASADPVATVTVTKVLLVPGRGLEVTVATSCGLPDGGTYDFVLPQLSLSAEQGRGRHLVTSHAYSDVNPADHCRPGVGIFLPGPFKGGHVTLDVHFDASYVMEATHERVELSASIDGVRYHVVRHRRGRP